MENQSDDITVFIKNYVSNCKLESSIMLSGPWGSGKSYYIQNTLIKELNKIDVQVICISLYGVNSILDLSKEIFLQSKFKKVLKKSKSIDVTDLVSTTIISGVCSYFNISPDINKNKLIKLFSCLNFTKTLFIFEDVERTLINIKELFGFITNLAVGNKAKILLVSNEDEIHKGDEEEYQRTKEKAISDTIVFKYNFEKTIKNIVDNFDSKTIKQIIKKHPDAINNILDIMNNPEINTFNFRSFIYACQKMADIFDNDTYDYNSEFLYHTFMGIVAFSLRKKNKDNYNWSNDESNPYDFGTNQYPIYKFAFFYIEKQLLIKDELAKMNSKFVNENITDKEIKEELEILYTFYLHTENEVSLSVKKIENALEQNSIPYSEYARIMNYLLTIKRILKNNEDCEKSKQFMINNIKSSNILNIDEIQNIYSLTDINDEDKVEFEEFFETIKQSIKEKRNDSLNFDFEITDLRDQITKIEDKSNDFTTEGHFVSLFNISNFMNIIKQCSAVDINIIREMFLHIYSFSNLKDFFSADRLKLIDLKNSLNNYIETSAKMDCIKKLQIGWLVKNIDNVLLRLNDSL